jgi:glycosyltransferase involved in cell wall biosynthesis
MTDGSRSGVQLSMTGEIAPASEGHECRLSVVIPIYNEEENIPSLLEQLRNALKQLGVRYEMIAVDDGSRDNGAAVLKRYAAEIPELKIVRLRRNSGQAAAIMAGLERATGEVIVTIDADLQNDPDDIDKLVAKLNEGYDVVSGWRKDRRDHLLRRNLASRIANRLISRVSGIYLHDYGCTLKAYRRSMVQDVRLYGEMHRFIPIYAHWLGARVTEIEVKHHPRRFGHSKYGLERIIKVMLDLLVIAFFDRYLVKPIYLFGSIGLGMLGLSLLVFLWMIGLRVFQAKSFISTPLPPLAAILGAIGIVAFLLGLLAEMVMRTYFESQGRRAYLVQELVNFDRDE